jgi:hypothetical protein
MASATACTPLSHILLLHRSILVRLGRCASEGRRPNKSWVLMPRAENTTEAASSSGKCDAADEKLLASGNACDSESELHACRGTSRRKEEYICPTAKFHFFLAGGLDEPGLCIRRVCGYYILCFRWYAPRMDVTYDLSGSGVMVARVGPGGNR